MSENIPATAVPAMEWKRPPQPGVWVVRAPRPRWWLYGLFLALTLISTTIVGARMEYYFLQHQPIFALSDDSLDWFPISWIMSHPANLLLGLPFSLTLMFILFSHEMGHYLFARRYRVHVTPPFFVPFPSLIGTLGAFIRIKSSIPSRVALFDIGIAGPIAGFIPACVAVVVGLSLSHPITRVAPGLQLGFPLAFHFAARLLHIGVPLTSLSLHPVAAAAWAGLFATSLNLLPGGQLDGGHIVFSIAPHWHRPISFITVLAMVPLGKYMWTGWFLWAVLLSLTLRHPRVPRYPSITGRRFLLAACAGLMLFLSFTPAPIGESSGRDVWPQVRDGSRQTLHDLRDGLGRLRHRK